MKLTLTKFKYRYEDKKGLVNIGIRLRFEGRTMEFKVREIDGRPYKIAEFDYKKPNQKTSYLIDYWKELLRTAYSRIKLRGTDMSLIQRVGLSNEIKIIEHDRFKEKVNAAVGFESSFENQEEVKRRVDENLEGEDYVSDDDYNYVYGIIQSEVDQEQVEKEFIKRKDIRNALERSEVEYHKLGKDRTSILIAVGELFLLKKKNDEQLFPSQYRGIIKDLYAFQYDEQASDEIIALSQNYFDDFIHYMLNTGVIKSSLNATPHELKLNLKDDFFEKKQREIISKDTFRDKIKALNKVITQLRLIVSFEFFDKLDYKVYLKNTVINNIGSRKEESLKMHELTDLLNYHTSDENKRLSLDIFLIMIFSGGLRGYSSNLISFNKEKKSITYFHEKTHTETQNPVFDEIKLTLERYDWHPPKRPSGLNITEQLRLIAKEMNISRVIRYTNTKVDRKMGDKVYLDQPLHDCISLRFARKTAVMFLLDRGLTREQLVAFTSHADPSILKHYVSGTTLDEKRKMLNL